ncbi:MAG: FAD-binding protein [Cytophagales bacterium]|nr:FAD-binding protein [Cytophagales bacterium]
MVHGTRQKYSSYGGTFQTEAEVFYPTSISEIKELITFAKKGNRKITIAGSFHSFDNQNAGSDMVVSLKKMDSIQYNPTNHTMDVGPGANWGNIFKIAYKNYCVPYVCITGSKPTAAGTLSAHANSVFTPGVGKEGRHCVELDLLTTEGELLTCSRTQHSDVFYGAISGFGILGFITRIRYQLHYVGSPFQIKVWCDVYDNVDDLENRFFVRESPSFNQLDDVKSQSSLFYFDQKKPKFAIFNRRYVPVKKKQGHFSFFMYLAALSISVIRFFPEYANKIMIADEKLPPKDKKVLKGLEKPYYGTMYFEPDYLWVHYISKLFSVFGYRPKLYQNVYFIPLEGRKVTEFTQKTCELMLKYNLQFAMFDLMYIPKDEPFILSNSRYQDGFYINTTFFDKTNFKNLMQFYNELNHLCMDMGGKINLAKNLFIEPELIEKMYKKEIQELLAVKKQTDKDNLIVSDFFKQKFPSYF